MNIHRHRNLVGIFQFIGFMVSLFIFFIFIDTLKANNAFNPMIFFMAPILTVLAVRLTMIYYFPPKCSNNNCEGKMYLHFIRSRDYHCVSCGEKVKLHKLKDDATAKKRVNTLLIFLGCILFVLLTFAIVGIINNSN